MFGKMYPIRHCQDCAFFDTSRVLPDHNGHCLRTDTWTEPMGRICDSFVPLDSHTEPFMCPPRTIKPFTINTTHKTRRKENR